ncbi:hypothetical protein RAS1_35040 [Phycisphaerae bacterium RAS1]|nr:hypothetical protein RAS1_35040 [Phycisphaerae bacterium RAS1]
MTWPLFGILLFVTLVVQTTLVPRVSGPFLPVDLFLALGLLCGLSMPLHDARLAAWITGFMQGCESIGAIGIHALSIGLAGLLITKFRETINAQVWWGRALAGFLAALPAQLLLLTYRRVWQSAAIGSAGRIVAMAAAGALIAALLAALAAGLPGLRRRRRRFSAA